MTTTLDAPVKKRPKPVSKLPVVRAYRLENRANPGKVGRVAAVLPEYQSAAKVIQSNQMRAFVQDGEKFWNRREPGAFATNLSERYKRSVQNQVVAGLDSWLELSKVVISNMIARSSLPEETKANLWWLNKSNAHYRTTDQATVPVWAYRQDGTRTITADRRPAPVDTLALLRAMMKHVRRHRVSVPQLCGWRGTRPMGPHLHAGRRASCVGPARCQPILHRVRWRAVQLRSGHDHQERGGEDLVGEEVRERRGKDRRSRSGLGLGPQLDVRHRPW